MAVRFAHLPILSPTSLGHRRRAFLPSFKPEIRILGHRHHLLRKNLSFSFIASPFSNQRNPNSMIFRAAARKFFNGDEQEEPPPPLDGCPAAETILSFYAALNEKIDYRNGLDGFLSEECFFEDMAFAEPFVKKEEVLHFLQKLRESMGNSITFEIDEVHEAGESVVAVEWHLEWNKRVIPFSKGCSFFECIDIDERHRHHLIKKAMIFEESPIKPGYVVLKILKAISSILDRFPNLANMLLRKPSSILEFATKICHFMKPLLLPLMAYYTRMWAHAARCAGYFISIIISLLQAIYSHNRRGN